MSGRSAPATWLAVAIGLATLLGCGRIGYDPPDVDADTGTGDGGVEAGTHADGGSLDGGAADADAGPHDGGTPDSGGLDAGALDSGRSDSGLLDAGPFDSGATDSGSCSGPELCDGVDNDCNPATPDGADEIGFGDACDGPDADLCDEGTRGCDGTSLVCSDTSGETLDVCDGVDNDCNPATPDGFGETGWGTACDGPDSDLCFDDGMTVCVGRALACRTGPDDVEGPAGSPTCTDSIDNDCDGATDGADSGCVGNTPPTALFTLTPAIGTPATAFMVDASASSDVEDAPGTLRIRWDWESDGTWDTAFSTTPTASHTYPALGSYAITVEVRDSGGLSDFASRVATVSRGSGVLVVTTNLDEADASATPGSPGGTGFSLREAMEHANNTAGHETISVSSMTIVLSDGLPSGTSSDGFTIAGDGSVVIDATGIMGTAFFFSGSGHEVYGVEIFGTTSGYAIQFGGPNGWVHDSYIHDCSQGIKLNGAGSRMGPSVEVSRIDDCGVSVSNQAYIERSLIHHNLLCGIDDPNPGTFIQQNAVYRNGTHGILTSATCDSVTIWNNTFHANGGSGISYHMAVSGNDVRNNVFSSNGAWGMLATNANFATHDHNVFYSNTSGACSSCTPDPPTTLSVDPLYTDPAGDDYHLQSSSMLVDSAFDVGIDFNGAAAGTYDGGGPDRGAFEAP